MKYIDYVLQRINIIGNKHILEFPITLESIERLRKNKMSIEAIHVIKFLSKQLDVDEKLVTPNAHLIDDLGADDFTMIEVVTGVEKEFNVKISDEQANNIATVQDVLDTIIK